jgi:hypothetical protein
MLLTKGYKSLGGVSQSSFLDLRLPFSCVVCLFCKWVYASLFFFCKNGYTWILVCWRSEIFCWLM